MKTLAAIAVFLVATAFVQGQPAGWLEDFDSLREEYARGTDPLPAPWQGVVSMTARDKLGVAGTAAVQGPTGGWTWGHAFRPLGGTPKVGDALVAKVFFPATINWQGIMVGLTTDNSAGASGQFDGKAKAVLHVGGSPDSGFANITFRTSDAQDKNRHSVAPAAHPFLPADAWYEVRLTLGEDHTVRAEYRQVAMNWWIPIGKLDVFDGFDPRYTAIAANRQGIIDDIAYVVAPESGETFTRDPEEK